MYASGILTQLSRRLIVSCQSYPGEPLRVSGAMKLMAESALRGGASGIRAQGLEDIRQIRTVTDVPIIGLVKVGADGVFITPTVEHAIDAAEAGADIVAIDGTRRPRPDGLSLRETISCIHERTRALVMADIGSIDDARAAREAGADVLSTTLAGYSGERDKTDEPDFELLEDAARHIDMPVFAEGRIHTPAQAREALDRGAFSVVVGTAITHPATITSWFVDSLGESSPANN